MRCPVKAVRRAASGDVPAMVELWWEYMEFHRSRDPYYAITRDARGCWSRYVRGHLRSRNSLVLVAEVSGRIAGFCLAEVAHRPPVMKSARRYGAILDLAVTARDRRSGLGRRLFEECSGWFAARGLRRMELRVAGTNPVAGAFWKKMGFRPHVEIRSAPISSAHNIRSGVALSRGHKEDLR